VDSALISRPTLATHTCEKASGEDGEGMFGCVLEREGCWSCWMMGVGALESVSIDAPQKLDEWVDRTFVQMWKSI
jgi:hypothetical protein